MSPLLLLLKTPISRSVSTGSSGLTVVSKDQSMDMNGPVVSEKVLKSIQVRLGLQYCHVQRLEECESIRRRGSFVTGYSLICH